MPKKISEEKQNLIRKRIYQGCSVSEIAEECQIGRETVKRYKKNTPAPFIAEQDTGDNSIKYDYSTSLTKKEEAFIKKIEKEISLYEDIEEGWTFHLTKHDVRLKQSGLWWQCIVYPESAPERWIERLKNQGLRIAISPLHDKDTWNHESSEMVDVATGEIIPKGARYKTGDRKKAHWHVLIISDTKVGYVEMNELLRAITNCPYIQKCRSLKNAYDYFLHINAPNKYQGYEKDEIQKFNNFHIEPNKYEVNILIDEMLTAIVERKFTKMIDVYKYYQGQIEYVTLLNSKPFLVQQIVQDNWRQANPDGQVKNVRLVRNKKKDEV